MGLNGTIPVSASQAARKEWRAMPDHSYRSNGGEVKLVKFFFPFLFLSEMCSFTAPQEREHLNANQSAERTIHEVCMF